MGPKQNPFSLYDFLGYFVPGAFLLYALLLSWSHVHSSNSALNLESIPKYLSFEKPEIYVPFIILSYVVGHMLSFLSAITIEQYSIWRFDYPSKFLLGLPYRGYYYAASNKKLHVVVRTLVWIIILPVSLLEFLCGKICGMRFFYTKKLDDLLADIIRNKIAAMLPQYAEIRDPEKQGHAKGYDFFRYVYHYAVENAPNHLPKMQNYVALFGFLRTITLILVFFFWVIAYHVVSGMLPIIAGIIYLLSFALFAYIFFMGFAKFYRRFSLEALMATTVVYKGPLN